MSRIVLLFFLILTACSTKSKIAIALPRQSEAKVYDDEGLPYYEMPEVSNKYDAPATVARMIDGLGFRFYWATNHLSYMDLQYRPNSAARSSEETIDHILNLVWIIKNAVHSKPNINATAPSMHLPFYEKRKMVLNALKETSDRLKSGKVNLEKLEIIFVDAKDKKVSYPFWYVINGPLSDALWHVGQIVSFRRSSGNPFNGEVNVLEGKLHKHD
jgi:hypothetical protein